MSASKRSYTYYAFICYNNEDEDWAAWLQRRLEKYLFPKEILLSHPELPQKIRPVFKDSTDLGGGNLNKRIRECLALSEYLVVICSPRAIKSKWVAKEIQFFIDAGKEDYIIPFIIEGEPYSSNPTKRCFPDPLLKLKELDEHDEHKKEQIGIKISDGGRESALCRVIMTLFPDSKLDLRSLWDSYHAQEEAEKRVLRVSQSRLYAEQVQALCKDGDYLSAQRLALRILPIDLTEPRDRVYTPEAEKAFRHACMNDSCIIKVSFPAVGVVFSPDDSCVAVISGNHTASIWETATGKELKSISLGRRGEIPFETATDKKKFCWTDRIVSDDGDTRLVFGEYGSIDIRGFKRDWFSIYHDSIINGSFNMNQDCLFFGNYENEVKMWHVAEPRLDPSVLYSHEAPILNVGVDNTRNQVISVSGNGDIVFCGGEDYNEIVRISSSVKPTFAAIAPVGGVLLVSENGGIYYVDAFMQDVILLQQLPPSMVTSVQSCSSPFSPLFALTCRDRTVRIIDVGRMLLIPDSVRLGCCVSFTPDGEYIVSSYFGDLRLWSVLDGHLARQIPVTDTGYVACFRFEEDKPYVEVAHSDGSSFRWAVATDGQFWKVGMGNTSADRIEETVAIDKMLSLRRVRHLRLKTGGVPFSLGIISPTGLHAATVSDNDSNILIWDVNTKRCIAQMNTPFESIDEISFNNKEDCLLAVSKDKGIAVFPFHPLQTMMDRLRERFRYHPWDDELE